MVFDRASEDADGLGEARPELHLHHGRTGGDAHAPQKEPPETRSRAECYDALRAADSGQDHGGETKHEDARAVDSGSEQGNEYKREALRVADGRPASSDGKHRETADSRPGHSGWDTVDAGRRPALDAARVSPERRTHILDGEPDDGGGHRHGTGKPGKTEFPASWSDEKIISSVLDVASRPDQPPKYQQYKGEHKERWLTRGTRDGVDIVAVITQDGQIWTGWPKSGPGVVRNPRER